MNSEQILMYVVALILGMLLANMLKGVCGCKVVEGLGGPETTVSDYVEVSVPTNDANRELRAREILWENR